MLVHERSTQMLHRLRRMRRDRSRGSRTRHPRNRDLLVEQLEKSRADHLCDACPINAISSRRVSRSRRGRNARAS